jgi:predicted phosphodiesterase
MKMISKRMSDAFMNGKAKKDGNTYTDGKSLYLFGNKIAEHHADGMYITSAGWLTKTTKERLNSLPNVSIFQKRKEWYLNGEKWNGDWIKVSDSEPPAFDEKKVGTSFDTSTKWVASDGWRGYSEPTYGVFGANDTGMWEDSPCRSDVAEAELTGAEKFLKSHDIPTKIMTEETSNVFCVHHYVIVPPKYYEKAKELAKEYYESTYTTLLYKV